jgi:hypothetical protein
MPGVKGRSGRKNFVATREQRDLVKDLAGRAVPQALICRAILNPQTGEPISEPTLRRVFRQELDIGRTLVTVRVGNFLVDAVLGTRPAFGQPIRSEWVRVKAAMFYLERRAGWTSGSAPQSSRVDAPPARYRDIADRRQRLLAKINERISERADAAQGVNV